jgi:hypothetical protein
VSSLDRAGDVSPSWSKTPSRPEQDWDVTGSSAVGAAVTEPVTGGGWCKGGRGSAVTRPLIRVWSEPRRKKPYGVEIVS